MKTILHTVNKSPFASTLLSQCITRMGDTDSLILLEDGVYAALSQQPYATQLNNKIIYAIEEDLNARGITPEKRLSHIQAIHYDDFVKLTITHELIHNWY